MYLQVTAIHAFCILLFYLCSHNASFVYRSSFAFQDH